MRYAVCLSLLLVGCGESLTKEQKAFVNQAESILRYARETIREHDLPMYDKTMDRRIPELTKRISALPDVSDKKEWLRAREYLDHAVEFLKHARHDLELADNKFDDTSEDLKLKSDFDVSIANAAKSFDAVDEFLKQLGRI